MIIAKLMGGLGNQLFQYAAGRALSLQHKTVLKLDTSFLLSRTNPDKNFVFRNYDLDVFNIDVQFATESECMQLKRQLVNNKTIDAVLKKMLGIKPTYIKEPHFHFYPGLFSLGSNLYLDGYWQSEKYFMPFEEVIRNDFTFKKRLSKKSSELRDSIIAQNAVCVNVRRGDFLTNSLHGAMGLDYYKHAESIISEKVANPVFYVFSDDIEWCIQHLTFAHPVTYVTQEYAGEKFSEYLQLMIQCKHFIIPNSSFAWWAAWLNNKPGKQVIAPKKWFNEGEHNTNDLIPASWMRL